jgi:hypothetical protein
MQVSLFSSHFFWMIISASDQDGVLFGTPAFNCDRHRHSAGAQRGTRDLKLVGWD